MFSSNPDTEVGCDLGRPAARWCLDSFLAGARPGKPVSFLRPGVLVEAGSAVTRAALDVGAVVGRW